MSYVRNCMKKLLKFGLLWNAINSKLMKISAPNFDMKIIKLIETYFKNQTLLLNWLRN